MANSPLLSQQTYNITEVKILVDGAELSNLTHLQSIEVIKETNRIAVCTVNFMIDDSFRNKDYEDAQIKSLPKKLIPGKTFEVKMGYMNISPETIFKGIIIKAGLRFKSSDYSLFTVECADKAVKMTLDRRNKYYLDKKDNEIISELISPYSLESDVQSTSYQHKEVVQYNSTDWDFLVSRAELNGRVVINEDGKISVKKLDPPSASVKVTQGTDVIKSNLVLNGKSQLKKVKASAWDAKTLTMISSESSEPGHSVLLQGDGPTKGTKLGGEFLPRDFEMHITAPVEKAMLKEWADARLIKSRLSRVTGTIKVMGMAKIKPHSKVEIVDFGPSYDGEWYISKVFHEIRAGLWTTEISIGLPNEWFAETKPLLSSPIAAGMLPGITGLYNGVVKKIDADPEGEFRVQVDIAVIERPEGIWARLSNFYASNNFGDFFYPEIGDEVLLGFLQGDPQFPVILGFLYHKKLPPPYTPDNQNTYKAIVTRSKMKIEFEDVKKILTIETPGGRRITLSDDQQFMKLEDPSSQNVILMDSSGIKLSTNGKIAMEAMQDITLNAKGKVAIDALMDVTVNANVNVSITGMAQATLKGNASATISSSGILMVNGSMVKIN